jgi:hypothetical protein
MECYIGELAESRVTTERAEIAEKSRYFLCALCGLCGEKAFEGAGIASTERNTL